jgi:NAD(P)-dependent dehydrogenase (short-subunit alcohol dehydrogenase family)
MPSDSSSNPRTALITGAGRGIGQAIARRLARDGFDIAACDLNDSDLAATAEQVREIGRKVHIAAFDVCDSTPCRAFVDDVHATLGGPHVLVNNAAVMPVKLVAELTEREIDLQLDVNLKAAIIFSQAAAPRMRDAGGGVILHMSSAQGHIGSATTAVYAATKAGLRVLAQAQAKELAADGIRVCTVSPGTVDSPMLHERAAAYDDPAKYIREADAVHPRGRIATAEEVAAVFSFLASDAAANITATDIRCDGGLAVAG